MLNRRTKGLITTRFHCQRNFALSKFHLVKFCGCEFSLWWNFVGTNFHSNEIWAKQNFTLEDAKFHHDDRNFSWLNENSRVLTKFCQIFARTKDKIHQISLSFLLHSIVSTVFHKPYSSINVNVKINVSTCLEQHVADIQMHFHEWLQQWRELNWRTSLPQKRDQLPGWFVNLLSYNTVSDYLLNLRKTWGTGLSAFTMAE